jgi:hypothetical protein
LSFIFLPAGAGYVYLVPGTPEKNCQIRTSILGPY